MFLKSKEPATPDYLSSEEAFKGSLSYEGRKDFIRKETQLGLTKYKGTNQENINFIQQLKSNPELLKRYEAARQSIITDSRNKTSSLRQSIESKERPQQRKQGFFRKLFGKESDTDKTFVVGNGGKAEFGINTTLCAKTTRENAKNLFEIDLPQKGTAGQVEQEVAKKYPRITLGNDRNTSNMPQVAYVSMDVMDQKGSPIGHVALAQKPRGSKEWFITDAYQGGQGWIKLTQYPAQIKSAYALTPRMDQTTNMRLKNNLEVREYKKGIVGKNERATNTPEIEYGNVINANNIFYALADRDLNGTMGDDGRRKRFLGLIPYGKKGSEHISDEYSIAAELQEIARLPKTDVSKFIAKCIEAGGGGVVNFGNRQDVMRELFGAGYNKDLHQKFLRGFDALNLSGYIDQVKTKDSLDIQQNTPQSDTPLDTEIRDGLLDEGITDSGAVKKGHPLYDYLKKYQAPIRADLVKQLGVFLNANKGTIGTNLAASADLQKHVKVVAGMAGGEPGVGLMIHGDRKTPWGKLNGTIGAWNAIPFGQIGTGIDLNREKVSQRLLKYDDSVKRLRASGIISTIGGGVEIGFERDKIDAINAKVETLQKALESGNLQSLPPEIQNDFMNLYNTLGRENYSKAARTIIELYKDKLATESQGWYLKGANVGAGYLLGLPTVLAAIRFAYLEKRMVPDKTTLMSSLKQLENGEGVQSVNTRAAGVGAINGNIEKFGGDMPFTARSGTIDGQNAIRFITQQRRQPLNVYAAPGFRENIRYQNGIIDVKQMPGYPFPTLALRTLVVGREIRHYLIVGDTKLRGGTQVLEGQNQDSRVSGDMISTTKTLDFPLYRGFDTIPNIARPEESEIIIGATLSREAKTESDTPKKPSKPHQNQETEEENPQNPNPAQPSNEAPSTSQVSPEKPGTPEQAGGVETTIEAGPIQEGTVTDAPSDGIGHEGTTDVTVGNTTN